MQTGIYYYITKDMLKLFKLVLAFSLFNSYNKQVPQKRYIRYVPLVKWPKTLPSHGSNGGSTPPRDTIYLKTQSLMRLCLFTLSSCFQTKETNMQRKSKTGLVCIKWDAHSSQTYDPAPGQPTAQSPFSLTVSHVSSADKRRLRRRRTI